MRDVRGYHFFTKLGQIFKQENALDRILFLNDKILKRNRALVRHSWSSQGGLTSRDVEKAAAQAKGKGKSPHERYFAKDLVKYRLTFTSYRLLVRGVYIDKPFLVF